MRVPSQAVSHWRSGGVYGLSCRGSLGLCGRTTGSCPCLMPCYLSKQNIITKHV